MYLDLDDNRQQDLIGFGTPYELTVSTDVWILAFLFVFPEVPLGTLAAGVTFTLAFVIWKKGFRLTRNRASNRSKQNRTAFSIINCHAGLCTKSLKS